MPPSHRPGQPASLTRIKQLERMMRKQARAVRKEAKRVQKEAKGGRRLCSKCGGHSHNARTCTSLPADNVQAPAVQATQEPQQPQQQPEVPEVQQAQQPTPAKWNMSRELDVATVSLTLYHRGQQQRHAARSRMKKRALAALGGVILSRHCSNCKQPGHYSTTCTAIHQLPPPPPVPLPFQVRLATVVPPMQLPIVPIVQVQSQQLHQPSQIWRRFTAPAFPLAFRL